MAKSSRIKGMIGAAVVLLLTGIIFVIVYSIIQIINNPIDKVKSYLSTGNEKSAVNFYNEESMSSKERTQIDVLINNYIANIRKNWDKGTPLDNSREILSYFTDINNDAVSANAQRHISYITAEEYLNEKNLKEFTLFYNENTISPADIDMINTELGKHISAVKKEWLNDSSSLDQCIKILEPVSTIKNDEMSDMVKETIQFISIEDHLKKEKLNYLVDFYNNNTFSEKTKTEIDNDITSYIDEIVLSWSEERLKYSEAENKLKFLSGISDKELSAKSSEAAEFISTENEGNEAFRKTLAAYHEKNYIETMKNASVPSSKYSQYSVLNTIYKHSRNELLADIRYPQTVDEYKRSAELLDSYINEVSDSEFTELKDELKKDVDEYSEVYKILNEAADSFENEAYKNSFITLEKGTGKYPKDKKIKYALSALQYSYIVSVTNDVIDYTEDDEYDKAEELLEEAIEIYDCDEFHSLLDDVKSESGYLNSASARIGNTGFYLEKSGNKLLMDDFGSDEKDIISALTGSLSSSLLNADTKVDVRDLALDMTEWGEDDYMGARLALDAVGVKSLIGALKYTKHLDTDKTASNTDDVAEELTESLKKGRKIVNTEEILSNIRKKASVLKEKEKNAAKKITVYEPVYTVNQSLAGKIHPKTEVKYVQKKIDLSDDRHITGVFPKFESKYDTQLPKEYYKESNDKQIKYLSESLKSTYESDKGKKKLTKIFSSSQIEDIKNGRIPEGCVWHHNEKEGLMQLVDSEIHKQTAHTEGSAIWGAGFISEN